MWQKSPWRKSDVIICVWTGLDSGPEAYSFIKRKSDTQVPLLLLVKAHHCLDIHTTLSGPSASVSEKFNVFINLPNYLLYLVSCVFLPFSPGFVELSIYPAEKRTIQSWFKV